MLHRTLAFLFMAVAMASCMKWDYVDPEEIKTGGQGLFIINEGNFQYGNASLCYYDPDTKEVQTEVFLRANGFKLGDVAQSMTVRDGRGWIVVNNSHVIFAIDADNCRETGRIEGFTSPRYIHFVSDEKAYVSQIWDNRIAIVDPRRYEITGYIEVPDMAMASGSTEQMVQIGKYVYCNCFSYQNRIIKIDTTADRVVESLTVGIQPQSLVADAYGKLWTICNGGYEGSPYGYETPALYRIDPETFSVEAVFEFALGDNPSELCTNGDGTRLFWLNDDLWQMTASAPRLPFTPLIESRGTIYYGLTVDPLSGDIYIADAIDYQQPGKIYRYDSHARLIDEFYAGITPGAFAFK